MSRILVTGGTGVLGREVVSRLTKTDNTVRVMSRFTPRRQLDFFVEWALADLAAGIGLREAVAGVDVIVHAASSGMNNPYVTDVAGTARLLEHARAAGVGHVLFVSIVGIERISFSYYNAKVEAEKVIQQGGVPWSILRATQFHPFIDMIFTMLAKLPVMLVPDWQTQPIDVSEVAESIMGPIAQPQTGYLPELAGPEVLGLRDMARSWRKVRGLYRPILPLPSFGKVAAGFHRGDNTTPDNRYGKITWSEWLQAAYRQSSNVTKSVHQGRV